MQFVMFYIHFQPISCCSSLGQRGVYYVMGIYSNSISLVWMFIKRNPATFGVEECVINGRI